MKLHGVRWLPKDEASSKADTWEEDCYGWQNSLQHDYDWTLFVNTVCHPLLTAATVIQMAERTRTSTWPWVSAIEERGQAWDVSGKALISNGGIQNTKLADIVRRPSHLATACAVSDLSDATRALTSEPQVFTVSKLELIDIDTPEDLEFARTVAAGLSYTSHRRES